MAKVTVSSYARLPLDIDGRPVPVPGKQLSKGTYGTTGATSALPDSARFVRISTDTAITVRRDGSGADSTDDLMHANTTEFFGVGEGDIVSWAAV